MPKNARAADTSIQLTESEATRVLKQGGSLRGRRLGGAARVWNVTVIGVIVALYSGVIGVGVWSQGRPIFSAQYWSAAYWMGGGRNATVKMAWLAPHTRDVPQGELGDSIRRGELIFDETPLYAAQYTHSRIACTSCHAEGGIQPFASAVVGVPIMFPQFNERAGHVITLKDRIQECFVRSENGTPLPYEGTEMRALLDYIDWLSKPEPGRSPFVGRGLVALPELKPDVERGQEIYATQCAGCHGSNGEGKRPMFPPVWGPDSFNDGAGMNGVRKMASFVQHNMPQNRMGILSAQDAFDVAGFIHEQPRPAFNGAYKKY
jgi:thiosulfate dehydrogenase